MTTVGDVSCIIRNSIELTVYNAIRDFGFGGYGLDDLEEIVGGDWHRDLAKSITERLLDGRREDQGADEKERWNSTPQDPVSPVMTADTIDGDESGEFTVSVSGPFREGTWQWTGYADNSAEALHNAWSARCEEFKWDKKAGMFVRTSDGRREDQGADQHDGEDEREDHERAGQHVAPGVAV